MKLDLYVASFPFFVLSMKTVRDVRWRWRGFRRQLKRLLFRRRSYSVLKVCCIRMSSPGNSSRPHVWPLRSNASGGSNYFTAKLVSRFKSYLS